MCICIIRASYRSGHLSSGQSVSGINLSLSLKANHVYVQCLNSCMQVRVLPLAIQSVVRMVSVWVVTHLTVSVTNSALSLMTAAMTST